MNILGYLVTLVNIQSFGGPGTSLKDMSIQVNECGRLFNDLKNDQAFNFECFKQNGYCRVGNVGKYLSQNLRDYIFNGNIDSRHNGLILTLYYVDASAPNAIISRAYEPEPDVIDTSGVLEEAPLTDNGPPNFFMRRQEISEEDRQAIDNYVNGYWSGY